MVYPSNGVLVQSDAVVNDAQADGLVLHYVVKSHPKEDLYRGQAKGAKILVQAPVEMHPNPFVMQFDPQVLH